VASASSVLCPCEMWRKCSLSFVIPSPPPPLCRGDRFFPEISVFPFLVIRGEFRVYLILSIQRYLPISYVAPCLAQTCELLCGFPLSPRSAKSHGVTPPRPFIPVDFEKRWSLSFRTLPGRCVLGLQGNFPFFRSISFFLQSGSLGFLDTPFPCLVSSCKNFNGHAKISLPPLPSEGNRASGFVVRFACARGYLRFSHRWNFPGLEQFLLPFAGVVSPLPPQRVFASVCKCFLSSIDAWILAVNIL